MLVFRCKGDGSDWRRRRAFGDFYSFRRIPNSVCFVGTAGKKLACVGRKTDAIDRTFMSGQCLRDELTEDQFIERMRQWALRAPAAWPAPLAAVLGDA